MHRSRLPGCRDVEPFLFVDNYKYDHVYGIWVAKYKANYFHVCSTCQRALAIPAKDGFAFAQLVARRIKDASTADLPMMAPMVDVTRFAMKDESTAHALHRAYVFEPTPIAAAQALPPVVTAAVTADDGPCYFNAFASNDKACPDRDETVKSAVRKCRCCGYEFAPASS